LGVALDLLYTSLSVLSILGDLLDILVHLLAELTELLSQVLHICLDLLHLTRHILLTVVKLGLEIEVGHLELLKEILGLT
jgi:hypothetical protein